MQIFRHIFIIFFVFNSFEFLAAADPSQAAFEEGIANAAYFKTPQGHLLRYTQFVSCENPKGTVVFVQGRGTFLEFYEVLITPLLQRHFDVWMFDLSGQGGSSRLLTDDKHDFETRQCMQHVDSFNVYIEDTHAFIQEIILPKVQGALILGGYSTGAHIALRYLQSYPDTPFDAAFFYSPLLSLKTAIPNAVLSYLFSGAGLFISLETYMLGYGHEDPIFHMPFEGNPYTSDPSRFADMRDLCERNRHLMVGGVSKGWFKAFTESFSELWDRQRIQSIKIPVLIFTGGDDGVVDVSYNALFTETLAKGQHRFYSQGRHELFREKEEILRSCWEDFDAFMQKNLK